MLRSCAAEPVKRVTAQLTGGARRVAEERDVFRLGRVVLRARSDFAAGALELRHVDEPDAARAECGARAGAELRLVRRRAHALARLQLAGARRVHEHDERELRLAVLVRVRAHVAQQRLHLPDAVAHYCSHSSCTHEA